MWTKKASQSGDAKELLRYVYNQYVQKDPKNFVNLVLGGMSDQQFTELADIYVRESKEGVNLLEGDPEAARLIKEYETAWDSWQK